jgi:hypothetical protein
LNDVINCIDDIEVKEEKRKIIDQLTKKEFSWKEFMFQSFDFPEEKNCEMID